MNIFNKKYNLKSLESIKDAQKLKIAGIFILFMISFWFLFIYSKINKQILHNSNLLQQINSKNALTKESKNKSDKLLEKIKNLQSEVNCSCNNDIKKEITNYSKETGICLKSYMLLATDTKKQQDLVSYEFSGKIDQIIAFCNKLNLCKSSLECEEILISKKNDSEFNIKCTLKLLKKSTQS